jgi:hypothetical protein
LQKESAQSRVSSAESEQVGQPGRRQPKLLRRASPVALRSVKRQQVQSHPRARISPRPETRSRREDGTHLRSLIVPLTMMVCIEACETCFLSISKDPTYLMMFLLHHHRRERAGP